MSKATGQQIVGYSDNRKHADFYPTPPNASEALFRVEKFEGNVLEPACGDGAMSEIIKKYNPVTSWELHDRGYGKTGIDFLSTGLEEFDNVITNPPFKLAQKFIDTSKMVANKKIAMLLKLAFLEGQGRQILFSDKSFPLKAVYVFTNRLSFSPTDSGSSGLIAFAWFVWDKDYQGKPYIDWVKA